MLRPASFPLEVDSSSSVYRWLLSLGISDAELQTRMAPQAEKAIAQ